MFKIQLIGASTVLSGIAKKSLNFKNFTNIFTEVTNDFRKTNASMFASQGSTDGRSKWAPLSSSYAAWKAKNYPGKGLLVMTGSLKSSLTTSGGYAVQQQTNTTLSLGTADPKASFHQFGSGNVPARPILSLSTAQKQRWIKIAVKHLFK
jgi:phage gpG-like protein